MCQKSGSQTKPAYFWTFCYYLVTQCIFFDTIFWVRLLAQAGCFEYHEPYKWNNIFSVTTLIFLKILGNDLYIYNNDIHPWKKIKLLLFCVLSSPRGGGKGKNLVIYHPTNLWRDVRLTLTLNQKPEWP